MGTTSDDKRPESRPEGTLEQILEVDNSEVEMRMAAAMSDLTLRPSADARAVTGRKQIGAPVWYWPTPGGEWIRMRQQPDGWFEQAD